MVSNDKTRLLKELFDQKLRDINSLQAEILQRQERAQVIQEDLAALKHLLRSDTQETKPDESLAEMGFRDAARTVMKDFPGGMTNGDIRKHMTKRGYTYDLDTPFGIRMGNELTRMKEQDQVRKEGKNYVLTKKGMAM